MSRKGDCWDNAVAESFFATLETEALADGIPVDQVAATNAFGAYIDGYYNPRGVTHSSAASARSNWSPRANSPRWPELSTGDSSVPPGESGWIVSAPRADVGGYDVVLEWSDLGGQSGTQVARGTWQAGSALTCTTPRRSASSTRPRRSHTMILKRLAIPLICLVNSGRSDPPR
jgi:hypothetical protein